jgi:hypothetical protein
VNSIPSRGYLEVRFTVYALPDVSLLVLDFEYRVVSRHVQIHAHHLFCVSLNTKTPHAATNRVELCVSNNYRSSSRCCRITLSAYSCSARLQRATGLGHVHQINYHKGGAGSMRHEHIGRCRSPNRCVLNQKEFLTREGHASKSACRNSLCARKQDSILSETRQATPSLCVAA